MSQGIVRMGGFRMRVEGGGIGTGIGTLIGNFIAQRPVNAEDDPAAGEHMHGDAKREKARETTLHTH
jgi:hypothetical protein